MHKQIFRRRTLVRAASFLLAAFVVVGGLALQARARAEAYRLYLENGYRHAFAELSANLNELDVALQKGIYATSPSMLGVLCTQIYGKAMSAQMALGELPYSNVELEQTAAFWPRRETTPPRFPDPPPSPGSAQTSSGRPCAGSRRGPATCPPGWRGSRAT